MCCSVLHMHAAVNAECLYPTENTKNDDVEYFYKENPELISPNSIPRIQYSVHKF